MLLNVSSSLFNSSEIGENVLLKMMGKKPQTEYLVRVHLSVQSTEQKDFTHLFCFTDS